MKRASCVQFLVVAILASSIPANGGEERSRWYAGTWDSTINNLIERPRTVGVRIEVEDEETGMAVAGAVVTLRGTYIEEYLSTPGIGSPPRWASRRSASSS